MQGPVSVEEEIYSHEYLWRSAAKLLTQAEQQEEGSYYYLLPSLLMSFMAFEAFVNFCGFVLLPELWKDEKKHFKGKGMEGKLETIVAELPGFLWKKGESPYQDIKNLETFRDIVAHGKVIGKKYSVEAEKDGLHYKFIHPWDTYIESVDSVKSARSHIKLFCDSLLIELRKHSDHPHVIFKAFEGSLASGSGMARLT
jgi:hypothetical protein